MRSTVSRVSGVLCARTEHGWFFVRQTRNYWPQLPHIPAVPSNTHRHQYVWPAIHEHTLSFYPCHSPYYCPLLDTPHRPTKKVLPLFRFHAYVLCVQHNSIPSVFGKGNNKLTGLTIRTTDQTNRKARALVLKYTDGKGFGRPISQRDYCCRSFPLNTYHSRRVQMLRDERKTNPPLLVGDKGNNPNNSYGRLAKKPQAYYLPRIFLYANNRFVRKGAWGTLNISLSRDDNRSPRIATNCTPLFPATTT